jgi:hypothetical protein
LTDISRSGRLRRWVFWTLGGVALPLVGGFVFLVAVGMHVRAHNPTIRALTGMDSSTATDPVTVNMGQVVLRIPRNYFLSMPSHDIQGKPEGVEFILLGLMPSFEPKTDANRAEFDDFHGFGRKLDVLVSYKGSTKTGKDLFRIFYRYSAGRPMIDAEFGYQSFNTGGFDYMFHGTADDPRDFIYCRPKDQVIPPGEKPLPYFPSCERIVLVGDDIVVQFSFSRDFLWNAHDIERQMIDVLNRFRVSGPALEVIQ